MPKTSFKKQLETCFFLIHLCFHAVSTVDVKSSLNRIDIQKKHANVDIYPEKLYLDWIHHHHKTEHEKTSGFKRSKSLAVFEGSYWHLNFDIAGFIVLIPCKAMTSSCMVSSITV